MSLFNLATSPVWATLTGCFQGQKFLFKKSKWTPNATVSLLKAPTLPTPSSSTPPLLTFALAAVITPKTALLSSRLAQTLLSRSSLKFGTLLDASTHLYKRVCPSVCRSVGPLVRGSVGLSVRPSVRPSVRNAFFSMNRLWEQMVENSLNAPNSSRCLPNCP